VKRPFYVWIDDDAVARDHVQQDAAAKTRAREQAAGAMVTYAGIATVLFAVSMYAAHQCSTSDAAGWFFALFFAGALGLAFGVCASRELRTILASPPGREDAVDITMLAIGAAIVVSAFVLHFALHVSWPTSCLVMAIGASVGGGPILEAAS
jgi:hypothetical protein